MWRVSPVVVLIFLAIDSPLVLGKAGQQVGEDTADIAKVFAGFRSGLALFDIDSDGDLDCVTTVQEDYDESVPSATYVWLLKPVNGHEAKNITFYVRRGDTAEEFLFKYKNDDEPLETGKCLYSDYKDCLVIELPYQGSQECMLWISWEAKNNIPKSCTDQYEDKCEGAKLSYDEDTCSAFV